MSAMGFVGNFQKSFFEATEWNEIDGLVQERHNSFANTLQLCLSSTNPSKWFL